jgi:hypothetical protein
MSIFFFHDAALAYWVSDPIYGGTLPVPSTLPVSDGPTGFRSRCVLDGIDTVFLRVRSRTGPEQD